MSAVRWTADRPWPGERAFLVALLCALALACLYQLASLLHVWPAGASVPAPPAVRLEQWVANQAASAGRLSVSRWHLFGQSVPGHDPRTAAQLAPDTTLQLVLKGIVAGDGPRQGWIIIADGQGADRYVAVGGAVSDGVTLDSVYPDRAVLSRNGTLESLRLPRAPAAGTQAADRPATTASAPGFLQAAPSLGIGSVSAKPAAARLDGPAQALLRDVRPVPVVEGGRWVGVRLQAGAYAPLLQQLGLQPDDVVVAVNGTAIDSAERAQTAAQGLLGAQSANVTVRRQGKTHHLQVRLQ